MIVDVSAFLADLKLTKHATSTIRNYRVTLNLFFNHCHKQSAREVTANDVRVFLAAVVNKYKNNTYYMHVARLKTFFRKRNPDVYKWIRENVKLKIEDSEIEPLSKQQLFDLAAELKRRKHKSGPFNGEALETFHWCLASIGCRVGELCSLTIGDLEKDGKNTVYKIRFRAEITKTRVARNNYIPMISVPGRALARYLEKHRANAEKSAHLFLSAWGTRMRPEYVDRQYQWARRALGIKGKCTPHVLRHTYCTFLQENNVDPKVASSLTGHSVVTYLRKYGHPTEKRKKQVAKTYQIV